MKKNTQTQAWSNKNLEKLQEREFGEHQEHKFGRVTRTQPTKRQSIR
jgi:hypothetical protein